MDFDRPIRFWYKNKSGGYIRYISA